MQREPTAAGTPENPLGRLPDFIIGGAPRCGTTFLCHLLDRHPEIYVAKPFIPEPKVCVIANADGDEGRKNHYGRLFARAPADRRLVEKSSYYLENKIALERLKKICPEAKLIFMVREPVARAYSNYLRSRANGYETLSFEEAVEREGERQDPFPPEQAYVRPFDYLRRGHYDLFAQRYHAAFGRERVRFFRFEDIVDRPDALVDQLQEFLGVTALPWPALDPGRINASATDEPKLDDGLWRRLMVRMRPRVVAFRQETGLDLSSWGYD